MTLPSFTVLIPTKDRADTLRHSLRTVLDQDYERLSIVVSDNASSDDTRDVVEGIGDPRVRYVNPGQRVSMSENFEFALQHADSEWISVIGDDDGLMPGAIGRAAEIIRETRCLGMSSRFCNYLWPEARGDGQLPFLSVPTGSGYEVRDAKRWLHRVLRGLASYTELPMLYTGGFYSAELVARGRRGPTYFRARIPDTYSAVMAGRLLDTYVLVHEPLAVNGASRHSHGSSALGLSGRAEPAKQFVAEKGIEFHPWIGPGKLASIPLIVYDCLLRSDEVCGEGEFRQDPLEQLGLAWRVATPVDRERILEIASRNHIAMSAVEAASARRHPRDLDWFRRTIVNWARDREIPGAHGARTIREAAVVAAAVHAEAQEGPLLRGGKAVLTQLRGRIGARR